MTDVVGEILILSGAAFGAIAGIGQIRYRDLFARMHVATKPATLGLALVASGAMLRIDAPGAVPALVLVIALQFITVPVGAHLVGRAAHRRGDWDRERAVIDELSAADGDSPAPNDASRRPLT